MDREKDLVNHGDNNWNRSWTNRLSRNCEPILDLERIRYDRNNQGVDEPSSQKTAHDGYTGNMGYTRISMRAYRDPFATYSLTPMAVCVQGATSQELGWACATLLPQELTRPNHDSQQRVPLYLRLHDNIKTETADTKKSNSTNNKGMRLVMMERCGGGRLMDTYRRHDNWGL